MNVAEQPSETGRVVVWDTETTGLSHRLGDRIVEIACVELVGLLPTGNMWHSFVDPERDVPYEAQKVHGLSREFLRGKPKFRDIADDFLAFVGDSPMVAHNAAFDTGMANAELARLRRPPLRNPFVDTVPMAKRKFPGAKVTLDDLCRRFDIDTENCRLPAEVCARFGIDPTPGRSRHNALLDTQLLAQVYLELCGGRHRTLDLRVGGGTAALSLRPFRPARALGAPSAAEAERHAAFVSKLKNPLWKPPAPEPEAAAAPGMR